MAEANFNEFVAGTSPSRIAAFNRLVNIAGAITTLALVAGVAVWGYRLAVRDAMGVPVIQAMEGPMRVAPDDPGGKVANHIGLSVNRIAAEGSAGQVPDRIVLGEPPFELDSDDAPGVGSAAPLQQTEADSLARTLALAEELALRAAAEIAAETAPADAAGTRVSAPLPSGVVQRSPRPMPRPALSAAAASITGTTSVAATAPENTEVAPETLTPGTRLAQIGAFDDVETARREWDRIALRHAALFEGKSRVIQPATSVGRTFYRLRVKGFETEDDSRRFCSAIEAGDLRCIPVTTR